MEQFLFVFRKLIGVLIIVPVMFTNLLELPYNIYLESKIVSDILRSRKGNSFVINRSDYVYCADVI